MSQQLAHDLAMHFGGIEGPPDSRVQRPSVLADYLTRSELAAQLDITVRTLQQWQKDRTGPPLTMIGQRTFYRVGAVRDWLEARELGMVRAKPRGRHSRRQT